MVTCKASVRLKGLTAGLCRILTVLAAADEDPIVPEQPEGLVITSLNDGEHVVGSRHYTNEAVDVRSRTFPTQESKWAWRAGCERRLNAGLRTPAFRVLLEKAGQVDEHFHVQVRKGGTYRP